LKYFGLIALLFLPFLLSTPILAEAASGDLLLTINNPDPDEDDNFGFSVATTNTGNILVGAYLDSTVAEHIGSASLFDGETGELLLTINNPELGKYDYFGWSVATTPSSNLLIGAISADTGAPGAGTAYLFDGITGELLLTINNPTPEQSDRFGYSVATTTDGNLLIGTPQDGTDNIQSGSAYLFDGETGDLLLTINNPTPEPIDIFGSSVATTTTGDLLVGAPFDNTGDSSAGSAYLFDGTTGDLLLTINNPEPDIKDRFGHSIVATTTGNLLIGAPFDNTGDSKAGSAYLFDGITGELLLKINNPNPASRDYFGFSVATTNTGNLLIGSMHDDIGAPDSGSAYLFDGETGELLLTINNPTPDVLDRFGWSVATTTDGNLVIGAHRDNTGATNTGSAYLIEGLTIIQEIDIDINPSSINCKNGNGFVSITVFGSEDFDVSTIDIDSLELNGFMVNEKHNKLHIESQDAVLHLGKSGVCDATQDLPLNESVDVTLTGSNADDDFEGTSDIRIVKR